MRIAFVMEATHGGTARHLLELAEGLVATGHSIHVIYSRRRAERRFEEGLARLGVVSTTIVDMRRAPHSSDFAACAAILRDLRRNGPFNVVHGHSSKGGALARLSAAMMGCARVYTPHCFRTLDPTLRWPGRALYGAAELALSSLADAIIVVSQDEFAHAVRVGIPRSKLHLVHNGVAGPQRSDRAALRMQLGLKDDEVCVGFLARYVPQKAPERMIEVAARLDSELPPFRIAMVGNGPLESRLRTQAAATGVAERVIFAPGSMGPQVMSAFDIFAMPSAYEGMPYVLLEAAAAGVPTVATAVGGVRSVVEPERNGFIVPNWDAREFSERLSRLIRDEELRSRMGRDAREICKAFTIDRMVRETLCVYGTAIERCGSRRILARQRPRCGT